MNDTQTAADDREIIYASDGTGPLLQRDYSAVIEGAGCSPEGLAELVRERFVTFAPPETACFRRPGEEPGRLGVGDELDIKIALLGDCRVRVVHVDALSLTLRTLKGHPEAGRITFGADRNESGRTVFRIVSRTRASGAISYVGYLFLGKQMQSRCWIRFIDRVASLSGGRIAGRIKVRTQKVEEEAEDRRGGCESSPTFTCGGG